MLIKKETKVLSKKDFVNILTNMVINRSSDNHLFKLKQGFSDLFDLLDDELSSKLLNLIIEELSVNEVIGSVLLLTKSNEEEKIKAIFKLINCYDSCSKKDFSEIISGILKLLLRKQDKTMYNSKMFAEEITNKLFSKFVENELRSELSVEEFNKWLYKEENKNKINQILENNNIHIIKNSDISKSANLSILVESVMINEKINNFDSIFTNIYCYLNKINEDFFLHRLNVLDAVEIFKNNSLLGVLNKTQILQCFRDIYHIIGVKENIPINEVF